MTEVIIRQNGNVGHITLNRPDALNALTYDMILKIEKALISWKQNEEVKIVLVDANGDKAFCSGGDVSDLYKNGTTGNFEFGKLFWSDEYRLNLLVSNYPKPYVVFMHGFTMGGGVGISCHGSHRIVGDSSIIAMPECSIGLVPDVGGSYLLTRKSKKLLSHYKINTPLFSYHMYNEHKVLNKYVDRLKDGSVVALISDAGTPSISDPGFLLVRECHNQGIQVQCLPGPTAFVPAAVNSGLSSERFVFEGFCLQRRVEKRA